jgi:transposase
MNKAIPEIYESMATLRAAMNQEPSVKIHRRIQALSLLKSGQLTTRTAVARTLDVHRQTVGTWLAIYERDGLYGLTTIHTHPNRPRAISGFVLNELEARLDRPEGCRSYGAIQQWLARQFALKIPYKTIYKTVHTYLQARPKVPRKSNVKKDPQAQQTFVAHGFAQQLQVQSTPAKPQQPIRVFAQDETRLGLMTRMRRIITSKGVKPVGPYQHVFTNYSLYGAVEPLSGHDFYLELPALDTPCFQCFLTEFSRAFPESFNIVLLDRGPFHRAKALVVPPNVGLIFQPAHTPEVNPIERLWQYLKDQLGATIFDTLDQLKDRMAQLLRQLTPERLKSLTGFEYFLNAVNGTFQ